MKHHAGNPNEQTRKPWELEWASKPKSLVSHPTKQMKKAKHYDSIYIDPKTHAEIEHK